MPVGEEFSLKEPSKSLEQFRKNWIATQSKSNPTEEELSNAWAELIDCEMYYHLQGIDSDLHQVWLPGFHINVGGGSDDPIKDQKGDFEREYDAPQISYHAD